MLAKFKNGLLFKGHELRVSLTMADLASLVNTNCPILSFSSLWMHRAANSHSDLLGLQEPQRKAQRTDVPMSWELHLDLSWTAPQQRHYSLVSQLALAWRFNTQGSTTIKSSNVTFQTARFMPSGSTAEIQSGMLTAPLQ